MSTRYAPRLAGALRCPVCRRVLAVRTAWGRSGKPFLLLVCHEDGCHFRAFINDRDYMASVLPRLEEPALSLPKGQKTATRAGAVAEDGSAPDRRSITQLERGRAP